MVDLHINPELFAIVPEPTKEEYLALKKSICDVGQHKPIIVWRDPVSEKTYIIDGHTRNEACKELGIEPKFEYMEFKSWLHAMKYAVEVNMLRRHLSTLQKVEMAIREIEIEKKIAEQRQKQTLPKDGQKGFQKLEMPNGIHTGRTIELVSEKTGIPSRTVARIKRVLDKGSDEIKQAVASGKTSPAYAERMIKKEKMRSNPIPLPKNKFRIIYCNVPYKCDYELEGSNHPTLSEEEIINLKDKEGTTVTSVFAPDAVILFWTPIPKFEEALRILKAWGFTYKTSIVWSKEKEGILQEGTGHYIRDTCELLLISTKGVPKTPQSKDRPPGIIKSPRTKIPYQKPDITRHWIEKMYPNEKYLELFARETVNGWTGWGDHLEVITVEPPSTKKGTLDDYEK